MAREPNASDEAPDPPEAFDFGIEWISTAGDTVELNRRERAKRARG